MEDPVSFLVGVPYSKMNCWDLTREFYRVSMGAELKHVSAGGPNDRVENSNLIYSSKGEFEKVDCPEYGDIILIKIRGIESHIAVYLGKGLMLHTCESTGSVVDRTDRWDKTITGYYRLPR